eukprot:Ihof_evm12s88 gene=Ihof_evmTU12s88
MLMRSMWSNVLPQGTRVYRLLNHRILYTSYPIYTHHLHTELHEGCLELSHTDKEGKARMVDISQKNDTERIATAEATVLLGRAVFPLVRDNSIAKGNVLEVARLAGIMGAKQTPALIPLCHNIPLHHIGINFSLAEQQHAVHITAHARTVSCTGVEMEALT